MHNVALIIDVQIVTQRESKTMWEPSYNVFVCKVSAEVDVELGLVDGAESGGIGAGVLLCLCVWVSL